MTRGSLAELPAPASSTVRRFVEAVLAASEDPQPDNIARYLLASSALEDSPSSGTPRIGCAA
jgi:hypothetical protein